MLNRLSLNSLRKVYYFLINSNPDVNFYCMCMKNRKKEAVSQNLILYALELIRINIICRIPLLKLQNAGQKLGKTYLSEKLVRTAVYDLASRVIQHQRLIIDLFDCVLVPLVDEEAVKDYSLEDIGRNYIVNPYMHRLLDIASYNRVEICFLVDNDCSEVLVTELLDKYDLPYDQYQIGAAGMGKKELLNRCRTDSSIYVSTDYKTLRAGERKGCVPLYYRAPHELLQYAGQPELSKEFARVYHTLCSIHLFNGEQCYSSAYEHSFLCLAPALAGFIQHVSDKVKPGQQVVFLCDEYSVAFQLYQSCSGDQGVIFEATDVDKDEILIVDPVPGQTVSAEFIKNLEVQQPAIRYEKVTMSDYLGVPEEETRAFAQILKANLPAQSWDVDDEVAYTFETIINPETLREVRCALFDFTELFSKYQEDQNPDFKIKAKDAASLLMYAKAVTKELADGRWVK